MKSIHIDLGKDSYDIHIENGLLDRAGEYVRNLTKSQTLAVISDTTVDACTATGWSRPCARSITTCAASSFPPGKNINAPRPSCSCTRNYPTRALRAATISSPSAAASSATWAALPRLRSCGACLYPDSDDDYRQVDSSVGGKVGIDLPSGKNQAGSFYQPKGVLIDPELLRTLPLRFIHDGMGEVIKYGCIHDEELFALLEALDDETISGHWEDIIGRCCEPKGALLNEMCWIWANGCF